MRKTREGLGYFRFARFNTFPLYYLRAWHRLIHIRKKEWQVGSRKVPLGRAFVKKKKKKKRRLLCRPGAYDGLLLQAFSHRTVNTRE